MKKSNQIKSVLLIGLFAFSALTFAQKGEKKKQIKEKIETQKVAFLTQKLNLTTDEATTFWPVYNEFQSKKEAITKEFRDVNKPLKEKGLEQMTNEEATAFVDNQLVHAQKMLDLKKEYVVKFKKVINIKKVAALQKAEKEFQKELMSKVRNHQKGKQIEEE